MFGRPSDMSKREYAKRLAQAEARSDEFDYISHIEQQAVAGATNAFLAAGGDSCQWDGLKLCGRAQQLAVVRTGGTFSGEPFTQAVAELSRDACAAARHSPGAVDALMDLWWRVRFSANDRHPSVAQLT